MAQALVTPWLEAGLLQLDQLQLTVASEASAQALRQRFDCPVHTDPSACLAVSELLLASSPATRWLGGAIGRAHGDCSGCSEAS